ncbi:MAG: hypothetical protein M3410_03645 [Acidobacteriota bacterium]|nr:hypothetical protein [Acidobacteriota bacterium]
MKFSKLILKNILRNKRRTLLTASSIVVSLFLIITLATILTEFSRGSAEASPLRLWTRHSVSLMFDLPAAHQQIHMLLRTQHTNAIWKRACCWKALSRPQTD